MQPASPWQVFRTEIISRRLNKSATMPLMAAALTTVAVTSLIAAAASHPQVRIPHLCCLCSLVLAPDIVGVSPGGHVVAQGVQSPSQSFS